MANNNSRQSTSQILCRFFKQGACREGSKCFFSHNLSAKEDTVCKYYLRGSCTYGSECRYDHVKPNKTKVIGPPLNSDSFVHNFDLPSMSSEKKGSNWLNAVEFVPGAKYHGKNYAQAVYFGDDIEITTSIPIENNTNELCPWAMTNEGCKLSDSCGYIHGEICDLCNLAILHPTDTEQRLQHEKDCIAEHERDMEESFALQRDSEKICGICMEKILDKKPFSEARFGILSHCNHVFCLSCIRCWRGQDKFNKRVIRACPECRVSSNFVTPSTRWVDGVEEKKKLMDDYKKALSEKPCRYWNYGKGDCPFNEYCFYKHTDEKGNLMPPKNKPKRRLRANGEVETELNVLLWDYMDSRSDTVEILNDLLMLSGLWNENESDEEDWYD